MNDSNGTNSTVAIIQARMGSSRLQGKVLLPLAGHTMLDHIVERLRQVPSVDRIVVATTATESDRPLVEYCRDNDFEVFAFDGDDDDLLGRYIACGERYGADIIVMVCGDCPLFDTAGVEQRVALMKRRPELDFVDFEQPTIEGGVAVLRLSTYRRIADMAADAAHREHAALYLMEHPSEFETALVPTDPAYQHIKHRLWLDTPADYAFLREVYRRLYRQDALIDLHDVVDLLKSDAALCAINAHVTQKPVRAQGHFLCVEVGGLGPAERQTAARLAHLLIERHNLGLRLHAGDLDTATRDEWSARQLRTGARAAAPHEASLTLHADDNVLQPLAPNAEGQPQLALGIAGDVDTERAAELIAAHLGQQSGDLGHFVATLHSSDDGSHLLHSDCPLCGARDARGIWRHGSGVGDAICGRCGHVYLDRRPAPAVIRAGYDDFKQHYDDAYLRDPDGPISQLAAERARHLTELLPGQVNTVMELGCGYGHFLDRFDAAAVRVGIEPSGEQAVFARRHFGLAEIWQCGYEALRHTPDSWPAEGFDLICSFHVLEHVEQPREFIRYIKRHLKADGHLCLAVPNLLTLSPDLIELFFMVRGLHLHSFSPAVLTGLLVSEGFEIIELRDEPQIPMLRSSMMLVARPATATWSHAGAVDTQPLLAAARRFHDRLDGNLGRLSRRLADWQAGGERVFVYGGGVHSRALLELAAVDPAQVTGIVDDDPAKQGSRIAGIDVVDFDTARAMGATVFLVSSLASEANILQRLEEVLHGEANVFGVYRDIFD